MVVPQQLNLTHRQSPILLEKPTPSLQAEDREKGYFEMEMHGPVDLRWYGIWIVVSTRIYFFYGDCTG